MSPFWPQVSCEGSSAAFLRPRTMPGSMAQRAFRTRRRSTAAEAGQKLSPAAMVSRGEHYGSRRRRRLHQRRAAWAAHRHAACARMGGVASIPCGSWQGHRLVSATPWASPRPTRTRRTGRTTCAPTWQRVSLSSVILSGLVFVVPVVLSLVHTLIQNGRQTLLQHEEGRGHLMAPAPGWCPWARGQQTSSPVGAQAQARRAAG